MFLATSLSVYKSVCVSVCPHHSCRLTADFSVAATREDLPSTETSQVRMDENALEHSSSCIQLTVTLSLLLTQTPLEMQRQRQNRSTPHAARTVKREEGKGREGKGRDELYGRKRMQIEKL